LKSSSNSSTEVPVVTSAKRSLRDRWAVGLSIACAVHCAVTPLALLLIPGWGLGVLNDPWIEASLLAFVLVLGGSTVIHAYRHHQSRIPVVLFGAAFTGLCIEPFATAWPGMWIAHILLASLLTVSLLWGHLFGMPHQSNKSSDHKVTQDKKLAPNGLAPGRRDKK